MRISKALWRNYRTQLWSTDSNSEKSAAEQPRLLGTAAPPAPAPTPAPAPAESPCLPPMLSANTRVGTWGTGQAPSCQPDHAPGLLGLNAVIISLAFVISSVAMVCAANKWYEFLFMYTPSITEEYRQRQAVHQETLDARRRTTAARDEAAYRQRVEDLYSSIASTSTGLSNDHANLVYTSSGSSSPEIHPASPSSGSSIGSPPELRGRSNFGQMLFTSRTSSAEEPQISRWQRG